VLNRLHTEGPPLVSLAPQTRADALGAENTLQPPAEYATFSTSAIGLACQTVTTATARDLGLSSPRGLWCTGVTAGSAAANAGIQSNDVLLKINGSEMRDLSRLGTIVASSAPGHTVPVEIFRNGSTRTVQLPVDQLRH
jgi:serine protease Do